MGSQKEKRGRGIETLFEEIRAKNLPNLAKETDIKVQEGQTPKQDEQRDPHPRHIIIKLLKIKERILKTAREKQLVIHKGMSISHYKPIFQQKLCRT